MNRRKQFRAVATRFDKLAWRYQATVIIADIFICYAPDPTGPGVIREPRPRSARSSVIVPARGRWLVRTPRPGCRAVRCRGR